MTQNQMISAVGETTAHLNISNAQVEDGGEYTCVARNHVGQAAHSSRLNIYGIFEAPSFFNSISQDIDYNELL